MIPKSLFGEVDGGGEGGGLLKRVMNFRDTHTLYKNYIFKEIRKSFFVTF